MTRVVQLMGAELVKFRTTRTSWVLAASLLVLVLALGILNVETIDKDKLDSAVGVRTLLSIGGSIGAFFTLCVGVIGMAGEERHGLLGMSLAAAPERWSLVVAKFVTYLLLGAILGVLACGVCTAVVAPLASARGHSLTLDGTLARKIWLGSIVACALFAAIGVGLASLLKDQVLALIVGLAWLLLIDSIVGGVAPKVDKFFPGGALKSVVRSSADNVLPMGIGILVLLGYAALLAGAGAVALRQRDIT